MINLLDTAEPRRLDSAIVDRGIIKSRERAKEAIKNGEIFVNGEQVKKPSEKVLAEDSIEFMGENLKYVGRGGLKLAKAIDLCYINLKGKRCIDIGASTGGFTDCMLQNGAEKVWAVDVGHGQLAEKLRNDSRVVNLEKTDIRNVTAETTEGRLDFAGTDVSFISLKFILPEIYKLLKDDGEAVALIKPQFEAGKKNIGKNGIVKSEKVRLAVVEDIKNFATATGFYVYETMESPIKGGSGNTEYLIYFGRKPRGNNL